MHHRKFNVGEWQPTPPARIVHSVIKGNWLPDVRMVGLVGTIALHLLGLQSVLLSNRAHKTHREIESLGAATSTKPGNSTLDTLILVNLPSSTITSSASPEDLASLGPKSSEMLVTLLSPDPLLHINIPADQKNENDDSQTSVNSGDPSAKAAMFARYSGQIDARIERSWRRPRTAIEAFDSAADVHASKNNRDHINGTFACQVRILQSRTGHIDEVQLVSCNGSAAWQRSLLTAIFEASPLPAPPDLNVFTPTLMMTFTSQAYGPDSADDDYEREPMQSNIAARSR